LWGSNSFGSLSWNRSGGNGEIAITNSYPSAEWHTIFYKHNGSPILLVGANGELVSSNITVQTSSGQDILKLFNSAQTNTIITIGRDSNTGNCAQIYTNYIGNNDPFNNFTIAFGGKSPIVKFYNNFKSIFSGPVAVEYSSFSYTDATFTVINTSDRPRLSMALLGPNLLINEGIFSIHGKSNNAGNCMVTTYVHVDDNDPRNAYNFGFNGKSNNLVFKNDLSSSFGGKLTVGGQLEASTIRANAGGIHMTATPDMSSQGAGMGWNWTNGLGETNFWNNNANGGVAGGWTWIPTTNTVVGAPVMSLSQTGNLTLAGTISAPNLTVSNGSWTPVLTSFDYETISQVYSTQGVGRYSISGKSVTLFYSISFNIYFGAPSRNIILKGMPTICRVQAFDGLYKPSAPMDYVSWGNSNIAETTNPIKAIIFPQGMPFNFDPDTSNNPPYFGLGDTYDGLGIYFYATYPKLNIGGYTDQRMSGYITYMLP
jgi:hypothetical protein